MFLKQPLAIVFLLWLCSQPVSAQTQTVKLMSGNFEIQDNRPLYLKEAVPEQYCYHGQAPLMFSFSKIPSQAGQMRMKAMGIRLLSYIPDNVYFVAVPRKLDWSLLAGLPLLAASEIRPAMKLHPAFNGHWPEWALAENAQLLAVVSLFDLDGVEDALPQLKHLGHVVHYNAQGHHLTMKLERSAVDQLAALPFVAFIAPADPPSQPENLVGKTNHRSNTIMRDAANNRNYDGSGINVMLQDDGFIGPHIDYQGRVAGSFTTADGSIQHGDHVAGTIMGAGNLDPTVEGMAPGADLWVYKAAPEYQGFDSIWNDYSQLGIVITSTSYSNGCNAGYNQMAQDMDAQVRTLPSLMHVFSAGNDGTSDCGYGAGAGWGNITGGHKSGKNVIAVANLDYKDSLSTSSSRGPAFDGRIKPDVAAVGSNVYSTQPPNTYGTKSGTSMACPGVSGTMAQIYDAYYTVNGSLPEGGLMKAVLMNTADDLGNPGPDFLYGYGRINALNSVYCIENGWMLKDSLSQGGNNSHVINVPAGLAELRVMVYWTDYEASVSTTKALVNNLDFSLTDPSSTTYLPWVLDPTPNATNLNQNAVRAVDTLNNAEQVTLSNPAAGSYTVDVSGTAVPMGPQSYWVVYSFIANGVTVIYPNGGEGLDPVKTETIRWDAYGTTGTFDIDYSDDNGATWNSVVTGLSNSLRSYDWNVPAAVSGQCLVRVSDGTYTDQSDTVFTIIGVPANLSIDWACPDSLSLSWAAVSGATGYEVSMLGNQYMDSIATTGATSYTVTGLSPSSTYWFSVKSLGPGNAVGRRAIAIEKQPGTFNCPIPYDISVLSVSQPLDGAVYQGCEPLDSFDVSITIKNEGLNLISGVPVHFSVDAGTPVNETYFGTLSSGSSAGYSFTAKANLSSTGTHTLAIWVEYPGDGNPYNDTNNVVITVVSSALVTPPLSEDFESWALCSTTSNCEAEACPPANGWVNRANLVQDDVDWRVDEGGTPSTSTGPSQDYNPGTSTGNYVYLEASNSCYGKGAYLFSPCIDLSNAVQPQLDFAYSMYGSSMGTLHVDVWDGLTWQLDEMPAVSGDQGSGWQLAQVDLSPYNGDVINIRFRGVTGSGYRSDMALDDINITDNCPPPAASFSYTDSLGTVYFTDNSGGATGWQWDFGDGNQSFIQNPSYNYGSAGNYTVTLIVINACGSDTVTQTVSTTSLGPETGTALNMGLFPNPSSGDTWIVLNNPENEPVLWALFDARGRMVIQGRIAVDAGHIRVLLPTGTLPAGTYMVRVITGDETGMLKLVRMP